jgi:hypothetical protein
MADLNQFLNKDLTSNDMSHSNGLGAVAGGGGAGGLSMEERQRRLNQPRVLGAQGRYEYSRLGRQGSAVKARTADQDKKRSYDASTDTFSDSASYSNRQTSAIKDESQIDTKSIEKRQHFIEPPSRTHDKYA